MVTAQNTLDSPFELAASQFDLVIRRLADDLTYGSDASRFVGAGTDFAQSRPYVAGDSIRAIDWKVTARTGSYFVKDYEAPKRVPVYVVVDTSASMGVSSLAVSKHAVGVWIGAVLALVAYRRRNPVSLVSGGEDDAVPPPTLVRAQIMRWIDALRDPRLDEQTHITRRITTIEKLADRTSLLVVISDLHAPGSVEAIKRFRQRHDCLVLQLVDPAELGRLRAGFVRAQEAETGTGFFASGRSALLGESKWNQVSGPERIARELAEAAVDHVLIRTDQPFLATLGRALMARSGGSVPR